MRNAAGYAVLTTPDGATVNFDRLRCEQVGPGTHEFDTAQCCHCGRIVHIKAKSRMDEFGSFCRNCMKYTCPKCADGPCVPFMKRLEMAEARDRTLRSYGM